jgi:hypothetical protein
MQNVVDVYQGQSLYNTYNDNRGTTQYVFLTTGQAYRARVTAVNSFGAGPTSDFSNLVTVGTPTPPGTPRSTPGNGRATLHWKASAANGAAITKYVVTPIVNGVAKAAHTYAKTATSATITGLPNGKPFAFRIKGVNARGSGPDATAPKVLIGTPGAPTNVTAKTGHAQATLSWTAPASDGSAITGYTVTPYRSGTALKPHVFHSAATKETVTGLGSGETLTFVVAATNARGTGAPSAKTNAILID